MSGRISVVICAYDDERWSDLQEALRSLDRQTLQPDERIVVVDHNCDLLSRIRDAFPGVTVVANAGQRGLRDARNTGVESSSGSVIAFLDDDAVAAEDWLQRLSEPYADPDVAGAGGRIDPVWPGRRPGWFPREFDWVVGCSYRGMPEKTEEVRNLIGCNMSFRRDLVRELGGFRIGGFRFGYCDETELCIRLRQRWPSKRLVYVPEARVLHKVADDRTRRSWFVSRCYFEGGSKAVVAAVVGAERGLATEKRYARHVLPDGVKQGLTTYLSARDRGGLARAAMIVTGFTCAAAGYVAGRIRPKSAARKRGWTGELSVGDTTTPVVTASAGE